MPDILDRPRTTHSPGVKPAETSGDIYDLEQTTDIEAGRSCSSSSPSERFNQTATSDEILLRTLARPHLLLVRPIRLVIERENERVTAWSPELEEIGYGPDLGGALEDFQLTLAELYDTLSSEKDRLGPEMVNLWKMVQTMVKVRN